jgi:arginine decarboxylase
MSMDIHKAWTVTDSVDLYGVKQWGAGNFSISEEGQATVNIPSSKGEMSVALPEIIKAAQDRGHALPLLLRIENLLDSRIKLINESFHEAIQETDYQGRYNGVYPIKVNQQKAVIEEIKRYGKNFNLGLEAGSKAELMICLANLDEGGLLICNGYKDREFIDLGLWAVKLGYRCFFVIESPAELPLIIERSKALGIKPLIGLRIKVSAKVGGLWTETSGDRSRFGLSTVQLAATIDELRHQGMLDCLQLLHCHLGSQIPDINEIRAGVREASRFYTDLAAEGVPLQYIDLGGGLAVDYIGNQSTHSHSRNYPLSEYCRCLVSTIKETLDQKDIPHPTIITESGRATVAHTSVLLFDILDVMRYEPQNLPDCLPEKCHPLVERQYQIYCEAKQIDMVDGYNEALSHRDQIRNLFRDGKICLRERATAENLFLGIAQELKERIEASQQLAPAMIELQQSLADIYYGNFSVFQSLPDTWAIGQIFPVMPIHRLNEAPTRQASISDLTCDCDGKLDHFILAEGESPTLPLHPFTPGDEYILGVFLMGAYQETMGDLHNLFGDTNVVSVRINENGRFDVTREQSGDTISEVLAILEYNPSTFQDNFRSKIERAVKQEKISVDHTYFNTKNQN